MSVEYLSADELHELTGRRQRPAQVAWLKRNHWRHVVSADGDVRVARDYWRKRMVEGGEEQPAPAEWTPRFVLQPVRKRA